MLWIVSHTEVSNPSVEDTIATRKATETYGKSCREHGHPVLQTIPSALSPLAGLMPTCTPAVPCRAALTCARVSSLHADRLPTSLAYLQRRSLPNHQSPATPPARHTIGSYSNQARQAHVQSKHSAYPIHAAMSLPTPARHTPFDCAIERKTPA